MQAQLHFHGQGTRGGAHGEDKGSSTGKQPDREQHRTEQDLRSKRKTSRVSNLTGKGMQNGTMLDLEDSNQGLSTRKLIYNHSLQDKGG